MFRCREVVCVSQVGCFSREVRAGEIDRNDLVYWRWCGIWVCFSGRGATWVWVGGREWGVMGSLGSVDEEVWDGHVETGGGAGAG